MLTAAGTNIQSPEPHGPSVYTYFLQFLQESPFPLQPEHLPQQPRPFLMLRMAKKSHSASRARITISISEYHPDKSIDHKCRKPRHAALRQHDERSFDSAAHFAPEGGQRRDAGRVEQAEHEEAQRRAGREER